MEAEKAMGDIERRLRGLRSKLIMNSTLSGLLTSVGGSLGLLLLLLLLLVFLPFTPLLRMISLGALFGFGVLIFGWCLLRPLVLRPRLEDLALRVDRNFPGLANLLISSVQLWSKRRGNKEGYSIALIEKVALEAARLSRGLDFEEIIDRKRLVNSLRFTTAGLVLLLSWASLHPSTLSSSLWGLLNPGHQFAKTVLKVKPGDVRILRGEDVAIEANAYGLVPRSLALHIGDRRLLLTRVTPNFFSHTVTRAERSFTYWVEGRGVRSKQYEVEVVERPMITQINLKYIYPSYTGLPPLEVRQKGDVTALVGTEIRLRGESNTSLSSAVLLLEDTLEVSAEVNGRNFEGRFVVERDGNYHIEIEDSLGNRNEEPIEYRIASISDESPTVRIEEPGRDIDLPRSMIVDLGIFAADDFGLTSLLLCSKKGEEETRSSIAKLKGERVEASLGYSWDLSTLILLPGDVITYWVEVYDNDTYGGPKRGVSRSYKVRFPTLEEIYRKVAQGQEQLAEEIGTILPEQEELSERLEELSWELKKTKELSWEERKAAEELVEHQKDIAKKVKDVLDVLDETMKSMKNSIVLDEETLDKLMEVRRLLEEVETEEIRNAMERLREALRSLKPEEVEKAMKELSLSQEELKKRLERTLEILKRLHQEQRLKALAERAEELLEEQKEIREETGQASKDELDELAKREEELRSGAEELKKEMDELAGELKDSEPEVSQSLDSLSEAMEEGGVCPKMSEVSGMLSKAEKKEALPLEDEIIGQLSQLSSGLSSAQSQLMACRKKEIEEAIRRAAGDLIYLSKSQEEVGRNISEGSESPNLDPRRLARTEESLKEGVKRVADDLYETSRKSFFITPEVGRALSSSLTAMEKARRSLEQGNLPSAQKSSQEGVQSLNRAIEELFKSQSQLAACSSAGGLEEALGKIAGLAGEQCAVNQGIQSLLPLDGQGGRLSMEARAQMRRLAAQQASIAERLNSVAEGIGDRSDLLGDLARLAEEMEEAAKELEKSDRVERKLVRRMDRVLSRLLDAQKSLHRRDHSQRRRAEVGEDFPTLESPPELPPEYLEKTTRKDLLKALRENYPKEYEKLIRAYFKALSETY